MGSIATTCTCDGDTQTKLEKQRKENTELKRQLVEANKHKHHNKQLQSQQNDKITLLNNEKDKVIQQLQSQQQNNKVLKNKYSTEKRRSEDLKHKIDSLSQKLQSFKQKPVPKEMDQKTMESEPTEPSLSLETTSLSPLPEIKTTKHQQNKFQQLADIKRDDLTAAKSIAINEDIITVRDWLIRKPLNEKQLKTKLSTFLTERNESQRIAVYESYNARYCADQNMDIMDDISRIIKRGYVWEMIDGIFKSKVQFDAVCINDIVVNRANKAGAIELGSIVCCRNVNELKLISYQYKRLYGKVLKDDICKISSDKLYRIMVDHLFAYTRNDNETTNKIKIKAKIHGQVECLMDKNVKWNKFDQKRNVVLMIIGNTETFIRSLNKLYFEETQENLVDLIDDKFGERNLAANWMKLRIEYCSDRDDFYARRIHIAGEDGWNRTRAKEINWIFISMFGNELTQIQKKFDEFNYGDSKSMVEWIKEMCPHGRYAAFLIKMIQNCAKQGLCMV